MTNCMKMVEDFKYLRSVVLSSGNVNADGWRLYEMEKGEWDPVR